MDGEPVAIVVEAFESGWALRVDSKYEMADVEAAAAIDCERRVHLCHAACCTFDVTLSLEDLVEGALEWDPDRRYQLRRAPEGHCVHFDGEVGSCREYARRPVTCRAYSCREDPRVWQDFDAYVPAADLEARLSDRRRERPAGS